jgi:pimeloyl-ACP methyl ester carboxylesterase
VNGYYVTARALPFIAVSAGVIMPVADTVASPQNECVILLHGMARTAGSMNKIQRSLEKSGYYVANVGYPSRHHEIEVLAPMAIEDGLERCRQQREYDAVHFVTHSLGGILVRYYLADTKIANLGRVVMLGPPNQGSHAADAMQKVPGFGWINGPAALQLGKGPRSIPLQLGAPAFELGVIAGNRTIDPFTSAVLDHPNDGRVTVEDTRLEGMRDFRLVRSSHAFIMQKQEVINLVSAFLRHGSFGPVTIAE